MTLFHPNSPKAQQQLRRWRAAGLVGIDEAGRGPLAGPVCAAAVILPPDFVGAYAQDSKTLSAKARAAAADHIHEHAVAVGLGWADVAQIDAVNILNATLAAMRQALLSLHAQRGAHETGHQNGAIPDPSTIAQVLVDGNRLPAISDLTVDARAVIKGDALIAEIGAASIVAKVARDRYMEALDARFPGYEFARHKGYGTRVHNAALQRLGPCPEHRRSFAPVRAAMRAAMASRPRAELSP